MSRVSIDMVDMFDYLGGVEMQAGVNGDPAQGAGAVRLVPEGPGGRPDDRGAERGQGPVAAKRLQRQRRAKPSGYPGTTAMQILDECADAEWPGSATGSSTPR